MSGEVENLLKEAGIEFEVPGCLEKRGADAIYDGDLSSLGLEVNDNGELNVDLEGLGEVIKEEGDPDSEAHVIDSKYCR